MNPVDEFLKTAGWLDSLKSGFANFKTGLGFALPLAAANVAVAGTAVGIDRGISAIGKRMSKGRDYEAMLKANPTEMGKYDAGQVQMVFNSLRAQSPTMAKDPLIASSFVRKTLELAPETGAFIDPATAKLLAETERNLSDAKSKGGRGGITDAFRPTPIHPVNPDPFDVVGKQQKQQTHDLRMKQQAPQRGTGFKF